MRVEPPHILTRSTRHRNTLGKNQNPAKIGVLPPKMWGLGSEIPQRSARQSLAKCAPQESNEGWGRASLSTQRMQQLRGCTVERARELVGSWIELPKGRFRIWETEAYCGADDPASHAHRGRTPRNAPMFAAPGTVYVYLCYGMHHCFNLVTEQEGTPGAVLIRAVQMEDGQLIDGPGRVCRALEIDRYCNGKTLEELQWKLIPSQPPITVTASSRIGIRKAQELPWRFRAP